MEVKKEKKHGPKLPLEQRSLTCLLTALQGIEVVIELKNDSEVRGIVETSDYGMNTTLRKVTLTSSEGLKETHESYFVNGEKIRFVHIPPNLNTTSLISEHSKLLDRNVKRNAPRKFVERKKHKLEKFEDIEYIVQKNRFDDDQDHDVEENDKIDNNEYDDEDDDYDDIY